MANERVQLKGSNSNDLYPETFKKIGTVTPESGVTIEEVRCVQVGKIVEIHFFARGDFSSTNDVAVISGVGLPPKNVRTLAGVGSQAYYASESRYLIMATNGKIQIATHSYPYVNVDVVYTVD